MNRKVGYSSALQSDINVKESLSVRPKGGRQLNRVNLFNRTSRIDGNGHKYLQFVDEIPNMCENLKHNDIVQSMDKEIVARCVKALDIMIDTNDLKTKMKKNKKKISANPNRRGEMHHHGAGWADTAPKATAVVLLNRPDSPTVNH